MSRSLRFPLGEGEPLRSALRATAVERVDAAIAEGYYLEAVALEDSLISDLLEACLGMHKQNVTMNSLGQLAFLCRELDPEGLGPVADRVTAWVEERNTVVHQMVKVGPTHVGTWEQRQAHARATAEQGRRLVAEVQTQVAAHARTADD